MTLGILSLQVAEAASSEWRTVQNETGAFKGSANGKLILAVNSSEN